MNATGESDLDLWRSSCEAFREHHLRPRLQLLLLALMASREGPTKGRIPDGWRVHFPPMRQLSDLERADVRLKTSQADASDIDHGILLPQEVATSRYRPEGYSTATQIDLKTRARLLKLEIEAREAEILRAKQGENEPPPPGQSDDDDERQAAE